MDTQPTHEGITERFRRDGFAVVGELADPTLLGALRGVYDGMLDGSVPCPGTDRYLGGVTRQIMLPHLHHPLFADNPALDKARSVARELMQIERPQFHFSMLIYKPPGHPATTPWHQDMAYAGKPATPAGVCWPNEAICQFWLALDDVDETMGCMEFIPGWQGRPMPPHKVVSGDSADDGRLLALEALERDLDLASAVKCPLAAGHATVHGYATPHFTAANRSSRGRRAYIFSFADPLRLARLRPQHPA